jgi:deoxycytidylate deaminase
LIYLGGYFYRAIDEALKGDYIYRHGAILFSGKKEISRGRNRQGITNKYFKYKWNLRDTHAEVDAIIRSNRQKTDTILVIRINNKKKLMNSKPCLSCQAILKHFGIKKAYYSDKNGEINILKL